MKNLINLKSCLTWLRGQRSSVGENMAIGADLQINHSRITYESPTNRIRLVAAFLLLLYMGVGNVWGEDITLEITVSSFGSGTTSSYGTLSWSEDASDGTTISGSSVRIIKDASNMRFNNSSLYNTIAMPGAIKSIEVTKYSNTSRSITPYIHTSSMSEGTSGATALSAHTHPYTWEITAAQISADNRYFRLNFTASSAYYVGKIIITCAGGEDCSNKVTLTKGGTSNGSFILRSGSASGSEIASGGTVDNCDANAIVYIVPSPSTGYAVSGTPTATNSTSVAADGSNYRITYTKGSSISSTVSVSFAAQSYTVTFNKTSGTGGTNSVSATYNSTCPTIASAPTREGYDFGGYYTGSGGTGTKVVNADLTWVATVSGYTSAGKWVKAEATTLYAKWTAKTYTVTWKVNGQTYTTGTPSTSVSHDSRVTTLPTPPNPASYCGDKFVGWTTDENYTHGTSPLYTTASAFPNATDNQTFYAVFADYVP